MYLARFRIISGLMILSAAGCNFVQVIPHEAAKFPNSGGITTTVDPNAKYTVKVSWNPNHETAVSATGGGYKVYYSTTRGFDPVKVTPIDIPNLLGTATPTSTTISGLSAGTYYFRVIAYSSLASSNGTSGAGSVSAPSTEFSISVP